MSQKQSRWHRSAATAYGPDETPTSSRLLGSSDALHRMARTEVPHQGDEVHGLETRGMSARLSGRYGEVLGTARGRKWTDSADRCAFWIAESAPRFLRRVREHEQRPLILTGHGLSLRVDKRSLLVRDGYTHYPAKPSEWRFFNGALDIPPTIVVIDGSGDITMDAIDWLARHRVPLIRIRWDGQLASIVTSGGQAANASRVYWQRKLAKIRALVWRSPPI